MIGHLTQAQVDPNKPSIIKSSNATPPAIAALETIMNFSASLGDLGKLLELRLDPCNLVARVVLVGQIQDRYPVGSIVGGSRLHARRLRH